MAYALATGAGAAKGLDQLLARYLEEDRFAESKRRAMVDEEHRGKQLGLNERQVINTERATNSNIATEEQGREMGTFKLGALRNIFQGDQITAPSNTPEGRLKLSAIGMNPNEIHGTVPQIKGPEDFGAEESFYNGEATKAGFKDYKEYARANPQGFLKLRHQWTEEGGRDRRDPPMFLVPVADPNNPAIAKWTPRDQAAGKETPRPAGVRTQMDVYKDTEMLIGEIEALIEKTSKSGSKKGDGVGPIEGLIDPLANKLGLGSWVSDDPETEELLRNKLGALKAQTSFQEGGKAFTGTEKQLLDEFTAAKTQALPAMLPRLKALREAIQRRQGIWAGRPDATPGDVNPSPGAAAAPAPGGDLYQQYLEFQKRKSGGK